MSTRRRLVWLLLALVVVLTGAAALGMRWLRIELARPYKAYPQASVEVAVAGGASATEALRQLQAAGVLRDAQIARLYYTYGLGEPVLQAGRYEFDEPMSVIEVLQTLVEGRVLTHAATVVEGLTIWETADALAAQGFGDRDRFLELMHDPMSIRDLDPEADTLEGYLFPDTYHFIDDTAEPAIVAAMVENFRRRAAAFLERRDEANTVRRLVTLASIVEKEAGLDSEREIVAGVYSNRLRRGIALYADPTVIYALKRRETWDGNLRRDDLQLDDPYNTYVHAGLPPGPICSPGLASLKAAAMPAEVPFLYFVSRNDGSHVFAETLSEHNRNVAKWQRQYWRERWAKEKEQAE